MNAFRSNLPLAASQLIQLANDNGGRDNVSVILVKVKGKFADAARLAGKTAQLFQEIISTRVTTMAAKLILSMDGAVIKEYPLNKERMTIGRKPHNDIVIDNLAVSGEHAAIVTILHDSFLEDLDSTNGLEVNGTPTKKHFLQNNDVIGIGKYKLKYINDQVTQTSPADFEKTMVLRAPVKQVAPAASKPAEASSSYANTS